jgi:hypothetical protein
MQLIKRKVVDAGRAYHLSPLQQDRESAFMTCELCKRTEQNARGKYVHERLQQVGVTERVTRTARKAIWVTRFHCQLCGTHWRHEDDMHTGRAGWSVEHPASAAG